MAGGSKASGVAASGSRTRRKKPFGYDFVMGIPPSFLVITLCIMGFIFWWQNKTLDEIVGKESLLVVRRVIDGDQFLANNEEGYLVKVRLRAIDAPELDQPYGREAAAKLGQLLNQQHTDVIAFFYERDMEGRYIADVFTQTAVGAEFVYVQEAIIKDGLAWHFGAFDRRVPLKEMAKNASDDKIGLWADDEPVAPWKYRRQKEREAREGRNDRRKKRRKDHKERERGDHDRGDARKGRGSRGREKRRRW